MAMKYLGRYAHNLIGSRVGLPIVEIVRYRINNSDEGEVIVYYK